MKISGVYEKGRVSRKSGHLKKFLFLKSSREENLHVKILEILDFALRSRAPKKPLPTKWHLD